MKELISSPFFSKTTSEDAEINDLFCHVFHSKSIAQTLLLLCPQLKHLKIHVFAHISHDIKKFILGMEHHIEHHILNEETIEYIHGLRDLMMIEQYSTIEELDHFFEEEGDSFDASKHCKVDEARHESGNVYNAERHERFEA